VKIGILVVYLVDDNNERLLDIHLDYINKNTKSTFNIYAGINLLLPRFKKKLANHNFIKSFHLDPYVGPDDPHRGTKEQTHYLEQLIELAYSDGITHIAIMHPDSFPIKYGWDKCFESLLNQEWTLISNYPAMSACMFFEIENYFKTNLSLLPKKEELKSDSWNNFQSQNKTPHLIETGMGMAYQIEQRVQTWYKMKKTNHRQYHEYFAGIFDDMIFHLGSASEYKTRPIRNYYNKSISQKLRGKLADILPAKSKELIKNIVPAKVLFPEIMRNQNTFSDIRDNLLNNTDSFFKYLTQ
jgi:hypothetical protein